MVEHRAVAAATTDADRGAVGEECDRRKGILQDLDALEVPVSELEFRQYVAGASVDAHGVPGLLPKLRIVPLSWLEPRVAKHDVVLREHSLRAVHAEQTILTRMVKFVCRWCRERFPTFHPAYDPASAGVDLQLRAQGAKGLASCNMEVAWWDEPPLMPSTSDHDAGLATCHYGVCRGCALDMENQIKHGADDGAVIP